MRERRNRLAILEREIAYVSAAEVRALADLNRAGFNFRTIGQARSWLKAETTMQRLTTDEVIHQYLTKETRA